MHIWMPYLSQRASPFDIQAPWEDRQSVVALHTLTGGALSTSPTCEQAVADSDVEKSTTKFWHLGKVVPQRAHPAVYPLLAPYLMSFVPCLKLKSPSHLGQRCSVPVDPD